MKEFTQQQIIEAYSLTARDKLVLMLRMGYVEGREVPAREIGEKMKLSTTRVYRLQNMALRRLRAMYPD